MKRLFSLFALAVMTVAAADVTGAWSGDFEMKRGEETRADRIHMELKQAGDAISGTAGPNTGEQWAISNAKLAGDRLTFEVQHPGGGKISFDLKLDGDRLHGSALAERGEERMSARVDARRGK